MQQLLSLIVTFLFLLPTTSIFAATESQFSSPAGYWQTIDDVTHKPKSILEISETSDHVLTGRVVKIYPRPGYDQHEVCAACKGIRHNQPIVSMVVMERLKQSLENKHQWVNGEILDPLNGKTYHCNLALVNEGKEVIVRGYIGLPLFGRSQTWQRVGTA